jgi:phosphatidate cytidylyltransferase
MPDVKDAMEQPENNDPIIDTPSARSRWEGLTTRIASSAILAVIFLVILWIGGWLFTWLTIIAGLMMMREWNGLTEHDGPLWRFAGLFYVSVPCASLIWLRNVHFDNVANAGLDLVFFVMLTVCATDVGAYFTGREFGGPKLAPVISPSKTWAGLGGGVATAVITAGISHFFVPYPSSVGLSIVLGILIALIAQGGDLFESWMKRRAGVKDSGTLIPGHGGILDRIDGLVFAVPLYAFLVWLSM